MFHVKQELNVYFIWLVFRFGEVIKGSSASDCVTSASETNDERRDGPIHETNQSQLHYSQKGVSQITHNFTIARKE